MARDVHESWKKIKCVCVFVGHGLRSTSFVLGVVKKSEVPIYSARPSLTYPSSFFVKQVLEQLQETLDYANC